MKKSLFISLIFSLLCTINYGQQRWILGYHDIGEFYVSFPQNPVYTQSKFHGWSSKDQNGQVTYQMMYLEAPSNVVLSIDAVESGLLTSMFEGDTPISKRFFKYKGYDAIDFLYESNLAHVLYKKGRVIIRGQKLYVLQVIYYHEDLADFDQFTNSLGFY